MFKYDNLICDLFKFLHSSDKLKLRLLNKFFEERSTPFVFFKETVYVDPDVKFFSNNSPQLNFGIGAFSVPILRNYPFHSLKDICCLQNFFSFWKLQQFDFTYDTSKRVKPSLKFHFNDISRYKKPNEEMLSNKIQKSDGVNYESFESFYSKVMPLENCNISLWIAMGIKLDSIKQSFEWLKISKAKNVNVTTENIEIILELLKNEKYRDLIKQVSPNLSFSKFATREVFFSGIINSLTLTNPKNLEIPQDILTLTNPKNLEISQDIIDKFDSIVVLDLNTSTLLEKILLKKQPIKGLGLHFCDPKSVELVCNYIKSDLGRYIKTLDVGAVLASKREQLNSCTNLTKIINCIIESNYCTNISKLCISPINPSIFGSLIESKKMENLKNLKLCGHLLEDKYHKGTPSFFEPLYKNVNKLEKLSIYEVNYNCHHNSYNVFFKEVLKILNSSPNLKKFVFSLDWMGSTDSVSMRYIY